MDLNDCVNYRGIVGGKIMITLMLEKIVCYLQNNEAWLSLVVNSVLTLLIIWQTFSLAKRQKKQEEELNSQQEKFQKELQKRQLQLDTFGYKNEIYMTITKVGQLAAEYSVCFENDIVKDKSYEQLQAIFSVYIDVLKIDIPDILAKLRQAEYFFEPYIYDVIYDVAVNFDEITGDVGKFKLYPQLLCDAEMEPQRTELLADMKERCEIINRHMIYLHSIIPKKLQINNLYD